MAVNQSESVSYLLDQARMRSKAELQKDVESVHLCSLHDIWAILEVPIE